MGRKSYIKDYVMPAQNARRPMKPNGYEHLAYAVALQAIHDYKELKLLNVITEDNQCQTYWPRRKDRGMYCFLNHYRSRRQVEELLIWIFDGSLAQLLQSLGSKVGPETIYAKLKEPIDNGVIL